MISSSVGQSQLWGAVPLVEDMPREMMGAELDRPKLLVSVWNEEVTCDGVVTPNLPALLVAKYSRHAAEEIRLECTELFETAKKVGFTH